MDRKKVTFFIALAGGLALQAATAATSARAATSLLWVDIRDIRDFKSSYEISPVAPDFKAEDAALYRRAPLQMAALLKAMAAKPADYFPEDVAWSNDARGNEDVLTNPVHGIELNRVETVDDAHTRFHLTAFVESKSEGAEFVQLSAVVANDGSDVTPGAVEKKIPVSETRFQAFVALIAREVILWDEDHALMKIYPIAPGGLDEGVIVPHQASLLTPTYGPGSMVLKKTVIDALFKPTYYSHQPYMPITNPKGRLTDIAFHIAVQLTGNPRLAVTFTRSFESHGCMRLRLGNLRDFHAIVKNQDAPGVPVQIALEYPVDSEHQRKAVCSVAPKLGYPTGEARYCLQHPHPFNDYQYMTIFDSNPAAPDTAHREQREDDEEHLIHMVRVALNPRKEDILAHLRSKGLKNVGALTEDDRALIEGLTETQLAMPAAPTAVAGSPRKGVIARSSPQRAGVLPKGGIN